MKIEEFEQAILASMLIPEKNERLKNVRLLTLELAEDRFAPGSSHRAIYRAIQDCYVQNLPIDLLTVAKQLGNSLEGVGGMQELRWIKDALVRLELHTTAGLAEWATVVDNAGRLRQIHLILEEQAGYLRDFEKVCSEIENVDEYLADLINRLHKEQGILKAGYQPICQHIDNWEMYFELQARGEIVDRVLTGWPSWDSKTVGLPKGELSILAGLPGSGKTQLALQMAYNIASKLEKGCVAINSLEMTSKKVIDRLACSLGEVDSKKLQSGQLSNAEITRLKTAVEQIRPLPIHMDDSDITSSGVIGFQASALHSEREKGPIKLLIIDFAELVRDERTDTEELRVSGVYRQAKSLAKNLDTAVLLLAQYSTRKVTGRSDKRGTKFDLRYSGFAEIAAGAVFHIYNPWQTRLEGTPIQPPQDMPIIANRAYISCDKNKDSPTGFWTMGWEPQFTRWFDLSEGTKIGKHYDF